MKPSFPEKSWGQKKLTFLTTPYPRTVGTGQYEEIKQFIWTLSGYNLSQH